MSDNLVHTEGGVSTLTINRVQRKNSLTADMYGQMADALAQAAADAQVRVVVIQGPETVFSAGNDIGDFLNTPPRSQDAPVFRFLRGISSFPKPLVAAVCGPAVGVGTTLLLHCDLVYAGDNAAFSTPFVNLGLCPEAASSLLMPQRMGHARAAEALMLGEPFSAESALEWGLINRIVPGVALDGALELAQAISANGPLAVAASKQVIREQQDWSQADQWAKQYELTAAVFTSNDAREGAAAFAQKRAPNWTGS